MSKKPNIVFDMGQVLMDFAPPTFIARLGYAGDDAQALLREVFKGWEWVAFDRGDVTGQDVVRMACSRLPERLHQAARELVFHWWDEMIPMPGAKEFLDELRSLTQVIIISDTFSQFAGPLMKKLGWPTIFCNELVVGENGEITDFKMRCEQSKLTTVKALQSIGFETIASGDSHNDLGMILASKAGFLFRTTEQIKKDYPQLPAYETYEELMAAIKKAIEA